MARKPRRRVRRSQPRLGHGHRREPLYSCVVHAIRAKVEKIAAQHGVSPSWVAAQLLADILNIPFPDRFDLD